MYMVCFKVFLKSLWEKWHMNVRNDTCTRFALKWFSLMDIKMKNFYLDLFQRLTVGEFTRYVTFEKI